MNLNLSISPSRQQSNSLTGTHSRPKVQSIDSFRPTPPTSPGAQRFMARRDRETVAYAYHALGRSVRWLAKTNRVSERIIEDIIRDDRGNAFDLGWAAAQHRKAA